MNGFIINGFLITSTDWKRYKKKCKKIKNKKNRNKQQRNRMIKSDKNGCSKFLSSYISGIATFLEKNIYSWRCWEKRSCQLKTNTYWFWFQNGLRKKNWLRFCFSRGWKKIILQDF